MASSPFSTTPTSLDDLPDELRSKLIQYFGESDLGTLRSVNRYWNKVCKPELRKRKRLTFNFEDVDKLIEFNDTFAEYCPVSDIVAGKFRFVLAALDTAAAKEPLDTFVREFGHLVTSLSLDLNGADSSNGSNDNWFCSPRRKTVLAHVASLLQKVKGQVEVLELLDLTGLHPSVIGRGLFPRLQTLIIDARISPPASVDTVALQEATIMLLSRKVPAVRRLEFKRHSGSSCGGDSCVLVNVLRNLVRVNRQVEVKLDMELMTFQDTTLEDVIGDDRALLHELMKETVRVVDLNLVVHSGDEDDRTETVGQALSWIGAQSDWLKKLTFRVSIAPLTPFGGLKFPRLRALEELNYDQTTKESLLQYDSPDHFPSLRTVTTTSTGNDFTVALPHVTALTVSCGSMSGLTARWEGRYGQALFQLPPFPNVETLTCAVKFVDLASIARLQSLRRFTVRLQGGNRFAFWKRVTRGAWRLTLEQIRALPEPSEDEVRSRAGPSFSDLAHLKEFTIVVYRQNMTLANLDALVFLSKTKRLQRLEKLEIEFGEMYIPEVPGAYLDELRRYHNSVYVTRYK